MPSKFLIETAVDIGITNAQKSRNISAASMKELYDDVKKSITTEPSPDTKALYQRFLTMYEAQSTQTTTAVSQLGESIKWKSMSDLEKAVGVNPPNFSLAEREGLNQFALAEYSRQNSSSSESDPQSLDTLKKWFAIYNTIPAPVPVATPATPPATPSTATPPAPAVVPTPPVAGERVKASPELVRKSLVGTTIQIGDKSIDIDPKTAKIEAKGDNFKISFANFEYITQSEILVDRDGKLITREIKIEKSSKLDNPFARAFTAAQQGGPEMLAFVDSLTDKSTYYPIQIGKAITLSKTPPAAVVAPPVAPAAGAIPEKEIVFPTGKYERHNWTIEIPTTPPTLRGVTYKEWGKVDDKGLQGIATRVTSGGTISYGNFENDVMVKGTLFYKSGESFFGTFKDGKIQEGKYTYVDGRYENGTFDAEGKLIKGVKGTKEGKETRYENGEEVKVAPVAPVAESAKKSAPADKTNPSTSPAPETDPKKSAEKKTEFLTGTRTLHGMSITIPSTPPSQTGANTGGTTYQEWGKRDTSGIQWDGTRVFSNGYIEQGIFKNKILITGIRFYGSGESFVGTYHDNGTIKEGKFTYSNGRYEQGTFDTGGTLINGVSGTNGGKETEYENGKEVKSVSNRPATVPTETTEARANRIANEQVQALQKEFNSMKGLKTNEKKGIFVAADTSKMPFEYIRRDISTGIIISRCTRPDPANSDVSILHHTVDPDGSRKVTMMLPDGSLVGALTFGSDKKLNIEKSIYKPNWKNYIQNYVAHAPAQK